MRIHLLMPMSRWNPSTHHLLILIMICPGIPLLTPIMQAGQDSDVGEGGWLRTNVYDACSGGVVVVALRDLVACEFSVTRPRGAVQ